MKRRALLRTTALVAVLPLLDNCGTPVGTSASPTLNVTQALAWAHGVENLLEGVNGAPGLLQTLAPLAPTMLTPDVLATMKTDLALADTILAGLSPASAPGTVATGLRTVESYFNAVMSLIGEIAPGVPGLAQYMPMIDAASVAIQLIEVFVNAQITAQGDVPSPTVPLPIPPVPGGGQPTVAMTRQLGVKQGRLLMMRQRAAEHGMTAARAAQLLGVTP